MSLSDTACRNAHKSDKAKDGKAFKLFDDKGLFLLVKPTASGWGKWWRFKYRFDNKEKQLSLGTYPEISLGQAREKRDEARKLVAAMIDPGENRKAIKEARADSVANSFEIIAREWGSKKVETWDEKNNRYKRTLERNIFPWLGDRPISEILPKDILACLRRIEDRGTIETAPTALCKSAGKCSVTQSPPVALTATLPKTLKVPCPRPRANISPQSPNPKKSPSCYA